MPESLQGHVPSFTDITSQKAYTCLQVTFQGTANPLRAIACQSLGCRDSRIRWLSNKHCRYAGRHTGACSIHPNSPGLHQKRGTGKAHSRRRFNSFSSYPKIARMFDRSIDSIHLMSMHHILEVGFGEAVIVCCTYTRS